MQANVDGKKKERCSPTPQPHLDTAQLSTVSLEPSGVRAGAWKPHGHGKQKARFQDSPHDLNLTAIQSYEGLRLGLAASAPATTARAAAYVLGDEGRPAADALPR